MKLCKVCIGSLCCINVSIKVIFSQSTSNTMVAWELLSTKWVAMAYLKTSNVKLAYFKNCVPRFSSGYVISKMHTSSKYGQTIWNSNISSNRKYLSTNVTRILQNKETSVLIERFFARIFELLNYSLHTWLFFSTKKVSSCIPGYLLCFEKKPDFWNDILKTVFLFCSNAVRIFCFVERQA